MQNPFTTTFSKIPDNSYIPTEQSREIISNFDYEDPSESLYKITGVRGSGKTVLLAKIEEEFLSAERVRAGWLVYRISPNRDMLQQLYTMLINDGFGKPGTVSDIGVAIDDMLAQADKKKKRILIGIDEVSKTPEMIVFAAEFGKWLRAGSNTAFSISNLSTAFSGLFKPTFLSTKIPQFIHQYKKKPLSELLFFTKS